MNKIDELIEKLCPNGVEYKELWEITQWDKKFTSVNKEKQKVVVSFKHISAELLKKSANPNGNIKLLSTGQFEGYALERDVKEYINQGEVITLPSGGNANIKYYKGLFVDSGNLLASSINNQLYSLKYIYYFLQTKNAYIENCYRGAVIKHPNMNDILAIKIPVPPLEIQSEIVYILDKFTVLLAELKARKKQYAYYRDKLFANENVEYKTLKDLAINCDYQRQPITSTNREKGEYPYYGASGIIDYVKDYIFDGDYLLISEDGANLISRKTPIAFSITGKNWVNNHAHVLKFDDMYIQKYVEIYLNYINLEQYISRAAQPKLNQENLNKILIPIPDNKTLINIVDILSKFEKLINDLCEGIPAEIEARQKQYEYYRDKLLAFKELVIDK